jgi:predicted metal-dependent HD superfamily phosphohydrolase
VRELTADWRGAVAAAGSPAGPQDVDRTGRSLLARWQEPHRRYHDAEHLAEVLDAVDLLVDLAEDPAAVRLAAWFHDAVYECRPGDDEEASALLAEQVLTGLAVPQPRVARVARLVRQTAQHRPDDTDRDAAVLCDADLAILGSAPDRYERYRLAVRAEYAQVSDDAFRSGRTQVLERLTAGPLYRTEPGRRRWQDRARANLAAELALLRP